MLPTKADVRSYHTSGIRGGVVSEEEQEIPKPPPSCLVPQIPLCCPRFHGSEGMATRGKWKRGVSNLCTGGMWYVVDLREAGEHPRVKEGWGSRQGVQTIQSVATGHRHCSQSVPIQQVPIFSSPDFSREAVSPEYFPKYNKTFT